MEHLDLIDNYRTLHLTNSVYAFFSSVYCIFTEINHMFINWAGKFSFTIMGNIIKYWSRKKINKLKNWTNKLQHGWKNKRAWE